MSLWGNSCEIFERISEDFFFLHFPGETIGGVANRKNIEKFIGKCQEWSFNKINGEFSETIPEESCGRVSKKNLWEYLQKRIGKRLQRFLKKSWGAP